MSLTSMITSKISFPPQNPPCRQKLPTPAPQSRFYIKSSLSESIRIIFKYIYIFFVQEYCRGNTEDINNNIVEFKEAVQIANVELDNKIVGCGKDLERCRADFGANLEKVKLSK